MKGASLSGRVAPRYVLEARITVESQSNFYAGFSQNISEGGVFVEMANPPPVGEIVRLQVHLDDGQAVAASGQVRWHRIGDDGVAIGAGVQFIALDSAATAALQDMLEHAAQAPLLME